MAVLDFSPISVPVTSIPYDDKNPTQNLEMLCFSLLQVLSRAAAVGFKMPDKDEITLLTQKIDALIVEVNAMTTAISDLSLINIVREVNGERLDVFGRFQEST